jgi:hypothetical protein
MDLTQSTRGFVEQIVDLVVSLFVHRMIKVGFQPFSYQPNAQYVLEFDMSANPHCPLQLPSEQAKNLIVTITADLPQQQVISYLAIIAINIYCCKSFL